MNNTLKISIKPRRACGIMEMVEIVKEIEKLQICMKLGRGQKEGMGLRASGINGEYQADGCNHVR